MLSKGDFFEEENDRPSKEERILGALCYIPFGCFAPLMMQKESIFLSFHIKQGGAIFGIYFAILFFLMFFPFGGFFLFGISTLAYIGLGSFGAWQAYSGNMYSYGFIEAFFKKFNK